MPRRAFWSQTRSARREILLTEEHGQRVRDPFCQRWASRLQATEARSNALLCQRGLGRNGAAFPFNPRGDLSPSGFGQLHRPSGKCCGEELKKMRRICVPNWMQPCRAGPPIGGASSFPQFSPKPPCTLPSEVLEFKMVCGRFHRFTELITTTSLTHLVFSKELCSREELWL